MMLLPKRRQGPELIDLPPGMCKKSEFADSLADIRKVNRYLGNNHAALKVFSSFASDLASSYSRPIRILDVATGSADIPVAIVRWARDHGISVVVTAVDASPLAVHEAAEYAHGYSEISVVAADGFSLPYEDGSFDVVLCNKTLHHFSENDTVSLLRELGRVSSSSYIIIDLRRSWLAWALIFILTRVFSRNRLTRHDGPLSVLRSYTDAELSLLAEKAGLAGCEVTREPFWLTVVTGRKH